jgi:hypothetical protein
MLLLLLLLPLLLPLFLLHEDECRTSIFCNFV